MESNNKNEFHINESLQATTIYKQVGSKLMIADLSNYGKEMVAGYMDLCEDKELKQKMIETMDSAKEVYFFNRLNVPHSLREQGYGVQLLQEVLKYCDKNDIFLVDTAVNSGDMGQKNLIDFYIKNGMTLIHKDGLLVYHSSLKPAKRLKKSL